MTNCPHRTPRSFFVTSALAAFGGTASALPLVQVTGVQDLGAPVGTHSQVRDVSRDGSTAVGYVGVQNTSLNAFVWTESEGFRMLDSAGVDRTNPRAISSDGRVAAGIAVGAPLTNSVQATIWDTATGVRTDLGFLPGGQSSSGATLLSEDGSTVFGFAEDANANPSAFRWTAATGMQPLGSLGAPETSVFGISQDGGIAVGHGTTAPEVRVATTWTLAGGLQPIPGLPGSATSSSARAVSSDGRFVQGKLSDPVSGSRFFYHDRSLGTTLLSSAAGFGPLTGVLAMSGDGRTLLLRDDAAPQGPSTLLWRPATGAIVNIDPTRQASWRYISENGDVVTGLRILPGQFPTPVRWTPTTGIEVLPILGGPYQDSVDVSADGNVIFGHSLLPSVEIRATIWRASGDLGESYCGPAVPNSTGVPGEIRITGTNARAAGLAELEAGGLPVGATAFFLASSTPGFVLPVPGSEGALCLGGSIGRYVGPGQVQTVSANGQITLPLDSTEIPAPLGPVTAAFGESWYFQAWHRDVSSSGAATSNFTNGVSVRFY